jgi:kinesin family protein 20
LIRSELALVQHPLTPVIPCATQAPSMPPFRQSKLTELFQSFFVGDGKAAMIVNVDPHATSYDMNMQVMKFAAVASEVKTIKNNKPVPVTPPRAVAKEPRLSRVSFAPGEDEEEVEYEELDPVEEDDDDGEPEDEYLNLLLDELSAMRTAVSLY